MANGTVTDKFSKLPELAKPSLYEIRLAPCLKTFKFKGNEKIHLDVTKPTNYLKLHANNLEVNKVSLKLSNGTVFSDLKTEVDKKWTLLTLHFPNEIQPQKVELDFEFNGEIRSELEGFYRSPYKDESGNEKFIASTQFESVYARKAFPCWDEPIYKAQFDVKMEVAEDLTALSNMNVVEEQKTGNGTKIVTFARTPQMSTYLVAFIVGNFEYIEDKSKDGIVVRVYTLPGKKEKGRYALEVGVKSLDYYSEWYAIKQPLPKCDLIGIPEFAMGAMENWGMVTFREAALLYDPALTSSLVKQRITLVVSHEIGHFWFGNLVTMKWWCDLWLKEGFASFMKYVFTGVNYPEFKIWLEFVSTEVTSAMRLDSLRNSHPIEIPIDNPTELDEIYDSITYAKSNSMLRMLFNHLGEQTFQKGLRIYLARHQFSNAVTDDLWKSLSEASGIDVGALMSSWTKQMGFPIISVEEKKLDGDKRELHVKQCRFLADGENDETNPQWQIPIPVTTSADPTKAKVKFLLTKPEDKFVVEGVKPSEWVKLNSGFTSFFRVHYSEEMFKQLLEGIKNREVDVLDRFQISNDLFATVQSGRVPMAQFLEFFTVCGQEDNLTVWTSINGCLTEIDQVLGHLGDGDALKDRFNKFVCKVVEPVAAKYGWEPKGGEDMQTGQLRATLIGLLSRSNHQPTIQTALAKFGDYVEKGTELVPDLRSTIFSTAARTNDPKFVEDLKKIMKTCNFSEIERACIIALGQCTDPSTLTKVYKFGIDEKNIKSQDIIYLFLSANASSSAATQNYAWTYFKENLSTLLDLYGAPHSNLFQHCLKASTKRFCSSANADEVEKFCKTSFDEHGQKTLDRPVKQILESIKLNEKLLQNNVQNVDEYLQSAGF